jgi:hypothetical protein
MLSIHSKMLWKYYRRNAPMSHTLINLKTNSKSVPLVFETMGLYISVGLDVVHVDHSDLRIVVLPVTGIQTTMGNSHRFMIHKKKK